MNDDDQKPKFVTNEHLQLEIKALRSDVKLWILAAVALNQFLAAANLPSELTGAALLAMLGKGVVSLIASRFGG